MKGIRVRFSFLGLGLFLFFFSSVVPMAAAGQKVVARVGDEEVTSDYLAGLKSTIPNYLTIKDEDLIRFAVQRRLFSIEARRIGLDQNPDVKTMLEVRRDEVLNKAYWVKVGVKEFNIPPEAVRSYYDAYPEKFTKPAQVRFLWIRSDDRSYLEQLKKKVLAANAKDRESLFTAEARKGFNLFPVIVKGVDRPWDSGLVDESKLPNEIQELFGKMEKGQLAGPVEYKGGIYLFYLAQRVPPQKADFESVKEQIEVYLVRKKQEEFLKKRVEELKKRIKVGVFEK